MSKRDRLSREQEDEQEGTLSSEEEIFDDTPTLMKNDFSMERKKKKVKQAPPFNLVKITQDYDQSHYKCVQLGNDYDSYMLFSANKTPTKEIKEVIFMMETFLLIRTVDNRIFYMDEMIAHGEVDCSKIIDKSSILKLVATSSSAYLLTKSGIYVYARGTHSFEPSFSIENHDEEFVDISASFVDNLLILTSENRILTTGWNKFGMLGDGTTKSKYHSLVNPETSHTHRVKIIVSGSCFSLYTSGSSLFACGELYNIGSSACVSKFERQSHFKFEASDVEQIIAKPLFTCFWTKQHDLHIYGRGFYTKLILNQNIYSIAVLYTNIFCSYKNGNEITQTRHEHVSNGEFTKEVVTGKYNVKWFNSCCIGSNSMLLFFTKPQEESIFKKVITNFFDIIVNSS